MASPTFSTTPDNPTVTYEALASIEHSFDDVDTQILSRQYLLTHPLYAKRRTTIAQIPNFWPIALEQAPAEIDQFILPSDSEVLAALTDISLERPEVPSTLPKDGDSATDNVEAYGQPRSFNLTFTFSPNDWFTNTSITKHFRYRRSKDGMAGLTSDPVQINWKKGKDLTKGLLTASYKLFAAQQKAGTTANSAKLPEFGALRKQLEKDSDGAQSFFSFFGYRGAWISEEESRAANTKYRAEMKRRQDEAANTAAPAPAPADEDEDEEVDMEDALTEIFPEGETLATVFAEDFFPGAIKYFTSAQEADLMSDDGFEDMDEDEEDEDDDSLMDLRTLVKGYKGKPAGGKKEKVEDVDASVGQPPKKKRKN